MSQEPSPAAELARHLKENGSRTVSTLEKEGIKNSFAIALANMHLFTISAGIGPSPIIALNKSKRRTDKFTQGFACGLVAAGMILILILFVIFGNKNVW